MMIMLAVVMVAGMMAIAVIMVMLRMLMLIFCEHGDDADDFMMRC
jgi:hypothetical protein